MTYKKINTYNIQFLKTVKLFFIIIITFFWQTLIISQPIDSQKSIKILFLGDLNFGESYQTNSKHNRGVNIIEDYSYDYMFENIKGLLKNCNLSIANLETPLISDITTPLYSQKPYVHWSNAGPTIKYLKKYNITALSIANNHTYDLDLNGFAYTLRALRESKIEYFGGGNNIEEASKPFIKQFVLNDDTITLAVLAGFEYRKSYDSIYGFYANEIKPGVNVISTEKILEQIKKIKQSYKNPFVVFFPHWGRNYFWKTDKQTEIAHSVIDAEADLIIGHGSHMVQEVELYNNRWIIYSIGNSIFNAPGRYKSSNVMPYSFIAELIINNGEKHLRLFPIYTNNLETDYQVRFLNKEEIKDCFELLKEKSIDKNILINEIRKKNNKVTQYFEIQLK